ncbi:pentatricopeptide repeat-containing protein At4g38150-like [Actinidia eriantha]|uniref:pentatricopeptide repeat-containing protein At4g38150-like n=1 Tax=Actinidia eriantha TaxID=165200 RepID=UPI002590092C|nr:pentatricopeptide repeat-containing protein At4g38150-like [Actinidia eriantha]XP_057493701.1 pentatricopeptide repeat-containing protein At4g38150-like [Actinidia eriantha]
MIRAASRRLGASKLICHRPPSPWSCSFSSIDVDSSGSGSPVRGAQFKNGASENALSRTTTTEPAVVDNTNPPDPIPNRPLRGSGRGYEKRKPVVGRQSPNTFDGQENMKKKQYSPQQSHDFLDKFKLGFGKGEKHLPEAEASTPFGRQQEEKEEEAAAAAEKPQDADDIFKKMKETGLIPNAVAMLDGLCKDGLVQEAMKLFGLMREKGTIPEVVIYTAVVEGFCKAQKLDDALRIFRKMHNNGISPNAFTYTVLIQGLYKGKRLDDALDLSIEMLEAGHSLNLATFAGLVDAFCRQKGLEEARTIIGALTQKGFSFDDKLVRDYLDKKGPFLPLVWEAIFGKISSQRSF